MFLSTVELEKPLGLDPKGCICETFSLRVYDSPKIPALVVMTAPVFCFDCRELMVMTLLGIFSGLQLQSEFSFADLA